MRRRHAQVAHDRRRGGLQEEEEEGEGGGLLAGYSTDEEEGEEELPHRGGFGGGTALGKLAARAAKEAAAGPPMPADGEAVAEAEVVPKPAKTRLHVKIGDSTPAVEAASPLDTGRSGGG